MSISNYYALAKNDYLYLKGKSDLELYNNTAVQAQQVVEKYLKHLVDVFCFDHLEADNSLKTHNLVKLNKVLIESGIDLVLDKGKISILKDYYFGAKYPGDNFIWVSKDEADECIELAYEVKEKVENFLTQNSYCYKCGSKLLSTDDCSNANCS